MLIFFRKRLTMQVTTFSGEGAVYRFRQGFEAITGVASHEALNIRVFKRYALNTDREISDTEIKIKFAIDPETKRLVVVGGESRATFKAKNNRYSNLLIEDPDEIKQMIKDLLRDIILLESVHNPDDPFTEERLNSLERKLDGLRLEASIKGILVDVTL